MNPETFAVCKSDLFMKEPTGATPRTSPSAARCRTTATPAARFDYLIANPPYGKDWKRDEEAVAAEHERGAAGRFGAGLPRISDGQLLFLQHMLAHMQGAEEGGSRVAIIMNGSPLFTGDAGSGESEIRRWILENDWLEALIALPEQLFYNTGIATYVWVLTNRKAAERKGKVQLIDATSFWVPMRKSLGDKRREIPSRARPRRFVRAAATTFRGGRVRPKIFPTTHFGYRKITVERPLRLNFQVSPERIARLEEERGVPEPGRRKKKGAARAKEQADGPGAAGGDPRAPGDACPTTLLQGPRRLRARCSKAAAKKAGLKLAAPDREGDSRRPHRARRDRRDLPRRGRQARADPELRDTENVPLAETRRGLLRTRGEAARARRVDRHDAVATRRTARSASSATRSTSTATSTSTSRRGRSRRSRPISRPSSRTSWSCCGRWRDEQGQRGSPGERRGVRVTRGSRRFKPYPRYKDSGIEWLGQIPAHWDIAPVYARYDVALGKMLDAKRVTGESPGYYLRNVDVQWDAVNTFGLPEMDFALSERGRYALRRGDLLVCEGGRSVGLLSGMRRSKTVSTRKRFIG